MDNKPIFQTKSEFIHSLTNIRLVIGNGFDLYCGLKTKYSDYFEHDKEKNNELAKWSSVPFEELLGGEPPYIKHGPKSQYAKQYSRRLPSVEGLNAWDLAFYLASPQDEGRHEKRWCDIEMVMSQLLSLCFPSVFQLLDPNQNIVDKNASHLQLAAFIHKKRNEFYFEDVNRFYDFLLKELMTFERNFGRYINNQIVDSSAKSFGIIKFNETYKSSCRKAIGKLCSPDNLAEIDTFNYGTLKPQRFGDILHHVNGDVDNPIFGIDSKGMDPAAPEYIFTKTYRRMSLDAQTAKCDERRSFENVVVFGHSLCESDYSYFFPVLDQLRLMDFTSSSAIVFAYSVYDRSRTDKIRSTYLKGISTLFKKYAESKGIKDSDRLIDSLTTQGRVRLYKIESLESN